VTPSRASAASAAGCSAGSSSETENSTSTIATSAPFLLAGFVAWKLWLPPAAIIGQTPHLSDRSPSPSCSERLTLSEGCSAGVRRPHVRTDALAELATTSASGPVAAVVVGEPGSGKSRLLAQARTRSALPRSFAVVGYEPERKVPLAAASALLRALGHVPEHGAQVEALLLDASNVGSLEPVRLFEAAHRALHALKAPALLVVDDLQWVDELSLALRHYLIRAARDSGQRLVVFAAARPGGSGVALGEAVPPERVIRIELDPLNREEGIELVCGLDARLDRGLAGELWETAKGSPPSGSRRLREPAAASSVLARS
jgi:hypothetical protein